MADTLESLEIEVKYKATSAAAEIRKVTGSLKSLSSEAKKVQSPLNNFIGSLKRIAFYRFIRSIIKGITDALSEGMQAAYAFSQGIASEGHRFAQAIDNVKMSANTMKGQVGSAFIALYAAVAPIIIAVLNLITRLADAMSQLFSAFTGRTYIKAQANAAGLADSMAGGAKAAKEWKNQLMGFDEINKLEAPGNTGGGGAGGSPSPFSFEDTPLDDWAMKIHDSLAAIELAAAGFALALGLLLTLSGINIPLGLALIALGVAGMVHALKEDWSMVDQQVARVLSAIMITIGAALLAVGIILLLACPGFSALGLGLVAAGVASLATGVIIDWMALPHNIQTVLQDIMLAAGGALLGIGLILALTGANIPLGIGLIVAGAATLAAAAAINWDYLTEMMRGELGEIMAIAGMSLLAIGLILVLSGVALPLGLGLMVAGGVALGAAVAFNWDTVVNAIRNTLDSIVGLFNNFAATVKNIINSIISFIQNLISSIARAISSVFSLRSASSSIGASVRGYASGGYPSEGQLFIARESGAEMVGSIGGHTAVANNDQIVEAIEGGVFRAMTAAGGSSGGKQTEFVFNLNGREFARAIYNDQTAVQREHGKSLITT